MERLQSPLDKINPIAIYSFIDLIRVWVKRPCSSDELKWLRTQCGSGGIRVRNQRARFDTAYGQTLHLFQPSDDVFRWVAERGDAHLNYVEVSLDWVFHFPWEAEEAAAIFRRHAVKQYHRDQGVRHSGGKHKTRYTGPRSAPNNLVDYYDKPSKKLGESECAHIDWRISGVAALRRAGIRSALDLIDFDFRRFWEKRLLLYDLGRERLGRLFNNRLKRSRRRKPWVQQWGTSLNVNLDARTGAVKFLSCGSVQEIIDQYRGKIDVHRCLVRLNVEHLLPPAAACCRLLPT